MIVSLIEDKETGEEQLVQITGGRADGKGLHTAESGHSHATNIFKNHKVIQTLSASTLDEIHKKIGRPLKRARSEELKVVAGTPAPQPGTIIPSEIPDTVPQQASQIATPAQAK